MMGCKYSILLSVLMSTASATVKAGVAEFIIMAEPNAPATAKEWVAFHTDVVKGINNYTAAEEPAFGIINGDITEFGRPTERASFDEVYNKLSIPFYVGLGDHDYQNNINDCATSTSLNFSSNACAFTAVSDIENRIAGYAKELTTFRVDRVESNDHMTRGSMAYSWDHITNYNTSIHFVQLHLGPTYRVAFGDTLGSKNYDILDSLSFLRDDLDRARRGSVDHIFINFHSLEWIDKATPCEQRVLKAIFAEYKISAVFVGHTHEPRVDHHSVFGDVPIYTTGALYSGYFDSLTVTKDDFQVTTYKVNKGAPELFVSRDKVAKPAPPPQCYEPGDHVSPKKGQFIRTKFIIHSDVRLLKQVKTGNALEANEKGDVYTNELSTNNTDMHWRLVNLWGDVWDNKYYRITRHVDGDMRVVVENDSKGNVYTVKFDSGRYHYWRIIKYHSGAIIQLQNLGSDRFLDANTRREAYGRKDPLKFTNRYHNWEVTDLSGKPIPNVRYFEPKTEDSWEHPVPLDTSSDEYWRYLGERALDFAAPCIWNGYI